MCADQQKLLRNPQISAKSASSAFYLLSLIASLLLFATPVAAQEQNRAGLVIVHGDGSVVTQCIAFAEESIGGAELLARSGLDLSLEASGMGATICRIDGEGCDFPAETCFCQCQGSPCVYWSYWRLNDGAWRYSNMGAGIAAVRNGDVDGWRWGLGTVDKAEAPPLISFEEICAEHAPASEPTVAPTLTSSASAQRTDIAPTPTSSRSVAAVSAGEPDSINAPPTPLAALGIVLGALVILPAATLLWVWLRARSKERGR